MKEDLLIQTSARTDGEGIELLLLFHGVGSNAVNMAPLGEALAQARPGAWVVSIQSPDASDLGQGWQWFSVRGITEESRPARVAAAMPRFQARVHQWQVASGASPATTTLLGFSQGAIMALESSRLSPAPAACIVSMAGRFAAPPSPVSAGTWIHLLHGQADAVVATHHSVDAADRLRALNAPVTLDLFESLGHGIDARVVRRVESLLNPQALR